MLLRRICWGGGGGEGIGDHLKWAGGRWGGREGILGNAYYWDLRGGGGEGRCRD
jgi:hypothetical protein